MHPLLNPGGASGLPTLGDAQALPRPAGFASTAPGQAETLPSVPGFASELDSLDELLDGATVEALDARDATPVELPLQADERNPTAPEPDAEQWLLSMLGQRDAQVQARDGEPLPPSGDAVTAIDEGADAQVLHGPLTLPTGGPVAPAVDYDAALRSSGSSSVGAVDLDTLPANTAAVFEALAPEALDAETASAIERAVSAPASRTETPTTTGTQPTAHSALPERTLKLQGPEHKWGEQMLHALRENVEMQVQQRMQSATIRLDPPELGSMEIFLSHESGRLSVQISAAQADVARLLQSTSERLRQELVGQNFMQVSVGVSSDGQSGQQHTRQERTPRFDEEPGVAANLTAPEQTGGTQLRDDVLITV